MAAQWVCNWAVSKAGRMVVGMAERRGKPMAAMWVCSEVVNSAAHLAAKKARN